MQPSLFGSYIMFRPVTFLLLLVTTALAVGEDNTKPTKLAEAVKAVTSLPEYRTAHWGMYVVDLTNGEVLLDHQSDKLFAPASVTKLFSVAAALDTFGADHRFHTKLLHTGEYHEASKTLQGDLIFLAAGDLTLGGRTLPDGSIAFKDNDHTYAGGTRGQLTDVDPLQGIRQLARQLAEKATSLQGDVLIDDRLFEKAESTGSGPGKLTPVLVNDNLIDFVITPDEEGKPAKVEHRPKSVAVQVDAQVETVAKGKRPTVTVTSPQPGRYVVRGQMPAGHKPLLRIKEVDDPASHLRSLLHRSVAAGGRQGKSVAALHDAAGPAPAA